MENESILMFTIVMVCDCGASEKLSYKHRQGAQRRKKKLFKCTKCRKLEQSQRTKKQWENEEFKKLVSESSKNIWTKEFRETFSSQAFNIEKTKQILGDVGPLRFNPKVVKTCQQCGKHDVVRYKGGLSPTSLYYCRRCVINRPEVKKKLSDATTKQWEDPSYRDSMTKHLRVIREATPRVSSIQLALYSILDDLNVKYYREWEGKKDDVECKLGPHEFDCAIPTEGKTILIECQGDYYHSKREKQAHDAAKATYVRNYFTNTHELKYIWEHEFYQDNHVSQQLQYWLGIDEITPQKYDFQDLIIQKSPRADYVPLLLKYHYLANAGRGGIATGAYYNNELVAVVVFSPPIRQNITVNGVEKDEIKELSRYCVNPKFYKKNLGSWFISRSIDQLSKKYKCIISYADTTFNHDGALYKACNFRIDSTVPSDYWYVSEDGWVMHKKTLYDRAKKMVMTEREFAEKNKYTKVWGKEKLRFIYKR